MANTASDGEEDFHNPYLDVLAGETAQAPQRATCFEDRTTTPQAAPRVETSGRDTPCNALTDSDDERDTSAEEGYGGAKMNPESGFAVNTEQRLPNVGELSVIQDDIPDISAASVASREQDGEACVDRLREALSELSESEVSGSEDDQEAQRLLRTHEHVEQPIVHHQDETSVSQSTRPPEPVLNEPRRNPRRTTCNGIEVLDDSPASTRRTVPQTARFADPQIVRTQVEHETADSEPDEFEDALPSLTPTSQDAEESRVLDTASFAPVRPSFRVVRNTSSPAVDRYLFRICYIYHHIILFTVC